MTEVFRRAGTTATFDENRGLLWVGLSECPGNDDIDHMWTIVSTFVKNYPSKCIVHLAHVDSESLEPPHLGTMMHIACKIATEFSDIADRCHRVIVQPKWVDDKVLLAHQLFANATTQKLKLSIQTDPEKVKSMIDKYCSRNECIRGDAWRVEG